MKVQVIIIVIILILTNITMASLAYDSESNEKCVIQLPINELESLKKNNDRQYLLNSQIISSSGDVLDIEWENTYGGSGDESGISVCQTLDGGYVISAIKSSENAENSDIWIIKIDHYGNLLWDKTYDDSNDDQAVNALETPDENYIVISNNWVLKIDRNGDEIWRKTYDPTEDISISGGILTSDAFILLIGTIAYGEESDIYILKIDLDGNKIWEKTFDKSKYDAGIGVCETSDGNYVILGLFTKTTIATINIWLIKVSTNGDQIADTTIGRSFIAAIFFGEDIYKTSGSGCIIAGYRNYALDISDFDYTLWKVNSNLVVEGEWVIASSEDTEMLTGIRQTNDGNYVSIGNNFNQGNGKVIISNSNGNVEATKNLGGSETDYLSYVELTNDNSFIIVGTTSYHETDDADVWLIKFKGVNTPPTIEITNPKNGETVENLVTIEGTASDANGYGTLEKVIVKIGNDPWYEADGTTSWSYVWDTTTVSNSNYEIKAKSYDGKDYSTEERINVTVSNNQPPNPPIDPEPADGAPDASINPTLSVLVSDPDGDTMDVTFYNASNNRVIDIDTGVSSGETANVTWSDLAYSTTYSWYAVADDGKDTTQSATTWSFTTEGEPNQPPNKPNKPSGPSSGAPSNSYEYSSTTTDPDGDDVKYGWDWNGNGTADEWTSFYGSGDAVTTPHSWSSDGTYYVKVIAEDTNGAQSDWSDSLPVTMPKNKPINTPFLNFLENHPHLFPILRLLLGLMRNSQQSLFSFFIKNGIMNI